VVGWFPDVSGGEPTLESLLRRLVDALQHRLGVAATVPADLEELAVTFQQLLSQAAAGPGAVVVIDGIDKLADRRGAMELAWLPPEVPAGVQLVLSATGGRPVEEARKRGWSILTFGALSVGERRSLVERLLRRWGKKMAENSLSIIVQSGQTGSPAFLRALLDELRVFGRHEELAVERRYLESDEMKVAYRKDLISHFRAEPGGPRRSRELPWLCLRDRDWDGLVTEVSSAAFAAWCWSEHPEEFYHYWTELVSQGRSPLSAYAPLLLDGSASGTSHLPLLAVANLLDRQGYLEEASSLWHCIEKGSGSDPQLRILALGKVASRVSRMPSFPPWWSWLPCSLRWGGPTWWTSSAPPWSAWHCCVAIRTFSAGPGGRLRRAWRGRERTTKRRSFSSK